MSDPVSDHKWLIEQFAARASSLSARLVRDNGIFSKATDSASANQLVASLDDREREVLARMLESERVGAIHDALVVLTEALVIHGFSLHRAGVPVPAEPFGYTLFQEFITLIQDDGDWSSLGSPVA
jgi:hypothetical protein